MSKSKLDKEDKKYLIITLMIGFVSQFFIDNGMNIVLLCLFMYLNHKYMATTTNLREYNYYNFKNKDKFDKGRKLFALLIDVYIVIRIITLFIKPQISYVFNEMLLIIIIYAAYENYLNKKYVESTNTLEERRSSVFIRNKIIASIILLIFIGFSYFTFSSLNELTASNYVKYGKYEYNLKNVDNTRKIEIKIGSHYMMGEENKKNSVYFNNYLKQGKDLVKDNIFRSYVFISMFFMFLLFLSQIYPKNNKVSSISSNIILVILLILSIFAFNFQPHDKKRELSSYFHNYISK